MFDILGITVVFTVMIVLLRMKWHVGYVLSAASVMLFAIYMMRPAAIASTVYSAIVSQSALELTIALTFIRMLEMVLRERNILSMMTDAVKGVLRNKKFVLVSMPLLIGMLPSIGGAYFSCPMVDASAKELDLTQEDKAFTNYWYRHPWEIILPLYPGLILATLITGIGMRDMMLLNLAYALCMLAIGLLFCMKGVSGAFPKVERRSHRAMWSFMPFIILLVLVIVFSVKLHYALVAMVFGLMIYFRYSLKEVWSVIIYGFNKEVVLLIFGVMLFKSTLGSSGAVANISNYFIASHIPLLPILFLLPFVTGILTGFTLAFVGSAFPLFMSLPGLDAHSFSFAFAAGYAGVLLSPVHVCLILTRDYFKADVWGLYKKIIPAVLLYFIAPALEYVIFRYLRT
ncbi:DUF401 family protein [Candidatus Magnetominusculus xianensis]|uniref:DUF401 family protein n=1 Tax=Candidatus Magnetominusculus xianensis TaxID=1748249 RepID=A0ABR5SKB4_9BACT|nr:DUF401 family protein [Candidatus Magnetominusculus xianensis]KWT92660.1 hypothetical protein ASN18_0491 [Candidatus Magnetominusculus xianensis]MBF0403789.1 DUF401 family protein [Nitrospirota bacterium]